MSIDPSTLITTFIFLIFLLTENLDTDRIHEVLDMLIYSIESLW